MTIIFAVCIFRYSETTFFKVIDDKKVILECLQHHLVPSNIFQYSLEDQNRLFGYMTVIPSVSPVSFISSTKKILLVIIVKKNE